MWCDDGWSYIPQLKIRRKFYTDFDGNMEYFEESWDGIVPGKVLYEEKVVYTKYNDKKFWMETSSGCTELYVVQE